MSTYYFMVCKDHKEKCDAASRTAGGYCDLGDSDKTLVPFIIKHHSCDVKIASEHDNWIYENEWKEWNSENVEKMFNRNPFNQ